MSSSVGFVGIGKTGSLFMQSALELFAHEQLLPTTHYNSTPCMVGATMGWHHASAMLWRRAFGELAWGGAFTFAVVRDPWARLVSHWAFHLLSKNPLDGGYLTHAQRVQAHANEVESIFHFRRWVRFAYTMHPPNSTDAWRFTSVSGHGNEQSRGFNASQLSWLVDEQGNLLVNKIYKLEDLEGRWAELQAHVCGLQPVSYNETRNHPVIKLLDHPSCHSPYTEYYDAETSAIVAEFMAPDIQHFEYSPPIIVSRQFPASPLPAHSCKSHVAAHSSGTG